MKTKFLMLTIGLAVSLWSHAQFSSGYDQNSAIPMIGFGDNCGFGTQCMLNIASRANVATGFQSMRNHQYGDGNVANGARSLMTMGLSWQKSGSWNVAIGANALMANITGSYNVAAGYRALQDNLHSSSNVAVGVDALMLSAEGEQNTAIGYRALATNNNSASQPGWASANTAIGTSALALNDLGQENTAVGSGALQSNTWADYNTAIGYECLKATTGGGEANTAIGYQTLLHNTAGFHNTAVGVGALYLNTTGNFNCANGYDALRKNTSGPCNTALGVDALYENTSGWANTAIGVEALKYNTKGQWNTAIGSSSMSDNITGEYNTAIGFRSAYLNDPSVTDDNFNTFVGPMTRIAHANSQGNITLIGVGATMSTFGQNAARIGNPTTQFVETQFAWLVASDGRFKHNVSEKDVKGLSFIMKLRPVTYNFNTRKMIEESSKGLPDSLRQIYLSTDYGTAMAKRHSGFIAQEVERAAQESGYDFDGVSRPDSENGYYGVSYALLVVPITKAVQEQQDKLAQEKTKLEKLRSQVREAEESTKQLEKSSAFTVSMESRKATVNIQSEVNFDTKLIVCTTAGIEIQSMVPAGKTALIDLSKLENNATYILALTEKEKVLEARKFIVK